MTLDWLLLILPLFGFAMVLFNALLWWAPSAKGVETSSTLSVSVLIPARDEAANIEACLAACLAQGSAVREVLVCDDHSRDSTADLVRLIASRDPRVRLLQAPDLPQGWAGKPHACHVLSNGAQGEWLLFLDADTRLRPGAVPAMIAAAEERGVTFVGFWPGLETGSFWERVLMPLFNFTIFAMFPAPLSRVRPQEPSLGMAHGACILAQATVYRRVGGHTLVKSAVFEDTPLARAWRVAGEQGDCLDGRHLVRVRMYNSFAGIWGGFLKNYYPACGSESAFWRLWAYHAVAFSVPFWMLLFVRTPATAAACGLVLAARLVLALRFRESLLTVALHPLGHAVELAMALASRRAVRSGAGVEWKGRRYEGRT